VSITITISGHTPDADTEAQVIEAAKGVCKVLRESNSEVYNASASTQHHGTVQLNIDDAEARQASGGQETDGTGHFRDVPEADRS
jgi:hypothetical protein